MHSDPEVYDFFIRVAPVLLCLGFEASAVGQYSPTLGMFMAVPPVPIGLYFYMAISVFTIVSSVAAAVVEGDTKLTLTLYLGILALGGAAYHVTYVLFESLMRSIWVPRLPLQPTGT